MSQPPQQKALANVCLFCNEILSSPSMCTFCGFKFCSEHKETKNHHCIKTRYIGYTKPNPNSTKSPNVASGKFKVVCENCGFVSAKPTLIEYAGEELIQHTQIVGCSEKIFLEEVHEEESKVIPTINSNEVELQSENSKQTSLLDFKNSLIKKENTKPKPELSIKPKPISASEIDSETQSSQDFDDLISNKQTMAAKLAPLVEQLTNLASLKEKGVLTEQEFIFIKKELIKNLHKNNV